MEVVNYIWQNGVWEPNAHSKLDSTDLVLVFGDRIELEKGEYFESLKDVFGIAQFVIVSSSGEILSNTVKDNSIIATAFKFNTTQLCVKEFLVADSKDSEGLGAFIADSFELEKLKGLVLFSDGKHVNGSELVFGINKVFNSKIPVSGGLAGDNARFHKTLVGLNAHPKENAIVVIGFYGDDIHIRHGSRGGWDTFGLERTITKSDRNILYELDGNSALDLYKEYLGDRAKELPGSALLFPINLTLPESEQKVVRTILNIDNDTKGMVFAGNLPEGAKVQLMKANFDKLIDGSMESAEMTLDGEINEMPDYALLISCIGRKLVLGQRVSEEIEEASNVFGLQTVMSGFYSYGEISPLNSNEGCALHNQTMTITTFRES